MHLRTLRLSLHARSLSLVLACLVLLPMSVLVSGCGNSGGSSGGGTTAPAATPMSAPSSSPMSAATPPPAPKKQGMSTGEKAVIVLAGAALLYYLYKKHQQAQAAAGQAGATSQLYQSKNGGIYYRDAQHRPVWVTAPSQGVSVPADQVQKYAPDYQQYQNQPVPPAPAGYQTQSATQYDPSLAGGQ